MDCPRCDGNLNVESYEGVEINRCCKCKGVWLDLDELTKILITVEEDIPQQLKNSVVKNAFAGVPKEEIETKEKCPKCHKLMSPINYSYSSGIIIDRCLEHGVWLDGTELEKIQASHEAWSKKAKESEEKWLGKLSRLKETKQEDIESNFSNFDFINTLIHKINNLKK